MAKIVNPFPVLHKYLVGLGNPGLKLKLFTNQNVYMVKGVCIAHPSIVSQINETLQEEKF
jgi:hypothetical protein